MEFGLRSLCSFKLISRLFNLILGRRLLSSFMEWQTHLSSIDIEEYLFNHSLKMQTFINGEKLIRKMEIIHECCYYIGIHDLIRNQTVIFILLRHTKWVTNTKFSTSLPSPPHKKESMCTPWQPTLAASTLIIGQASS